MKLPKQKVVKEIPSPYASHIPYSEIVLIEETPYLKVQRLNEDLNLFECAYLDINRKRITHWPRGWKRDETEMSYIFSVVGSFVKKQYGWPEMVPPNFIDYD